MKWPISWNDFITHVVDCDELGITAQVLSLAQSGGGTVTLDLDDHQAFWHSLPVEQPITFRINNDTGATCELNLVHRDIAMHGGVECISGFTLIVPLNAGTIAGVKVTSTHDESDPDKRIIGTVIRLAILS